MVFVTIPLAIFVLTVASVSFLVFWMHSRHARSQLNRAEAINWNAFVTRYMGTVRRQQSRFRGYLLKHTLFLTGKEEPARHMAEQTVRWTITLFMLGLGIGALFRSPIAGVMGVTVAILPLYNLKVRYNRERHVFYQELLVGGYIALPYMLKAGVSLEDGISILVRIGSGNFRRTMEEVCWLSGLPVRKNGQVVRLQAKPLTVIEALDDVSRRSDSAAFGQFVRRIKLALDKRISVADVLLEDGQRFADERKRKRELQKGKAGQRLGYIINMGMPSVMTVFVLLELTRAITYVMSMLKHIGGHPTGM